MGDKPSLRIGVKDTGFCPFCERYNMPLKPIGNGLFRCLKCGNQVTGKVTKPK